MTDQNQLLENWEKELGKIPGWDDFGQPGPVTLDYVLGKENMKNLQEFIKTLLQKQDAKTRQEEMKRKDELIEQVASWCQQEIEEFRKDGDGIRLIHILGKLEILKRCWIPREAKQKILHPNENSQNGKL